MTTSDDQAILANLDQWAGLSHKASMGMAPRLSLAPTWVPPLERRRLAAYTTLAAYLRNVSRVLLCADGKVRDDRREYGDPALLIARVVGAVLGDSTELVVEGAERPPPDEPDLPPAPTPLADDATPLDRRIYAARAARRDAQAAETVDAWEQAWSAYPTRRAQQDALRAWADAEMLDARLLEWNTDAVGLGDGVVELALSTRRGRPIVRIYEPGFYFPVLDDDLDDFPTTVHLAWEYRDDQGREWLRRKTYRQVTLDAPRRYPWAPDVDSWTTYTLTDATWAASDFGGVSVYDIDPARAVYATTEDGAVADGLDLGIDFLPVVHLPNTPTGKSHFGESLLVALAQLLDDIQEADTDTRSVAGLAAVPIVAASGSATLPADFRVVPGVSVSLGKDGRLDVVSLAEALPAVQARVDALLDRLAVNSRVSSEVMGRVDSSDAASGFAMLLAFGPFTQLIGDLRLTRDAKHALLVKFAGRMLQLAGKIEPGELAAARVVPGSFLPSDLADVVARVVALLDAHAISRQTALSMLVAGGLSIDDAAAELDRIRAEDTAAAKDVGEATTSSELAAEWLGLELPAPPAAPTVTLPPLPGATP